MENHVCKKCMVSWELPEYVNKKENRFYTRCKSTMCIRIHMKDITT